MKIATTNLLPRLLLALLYISQLNAMELVEHKSVSSRDALNLYSNKKDFYVENENAAYHVDAHNFNPLLNEIVKRQALGKFTDAGYIRINKLEDGKYALAAKVRGNGGGPVSGLIALWGTRAVGYGTFAVAVWATGGEALLHTAEAMHGIEMAANTIGLFAAVSPLP